MTTSYQIIFAGTPEFSAITLDALIQSPHQIKAVYTQPDRPAGRGRKLTPSPVKTLAMKHGLSVHQPVSLKDEAEQKILASLDADMMIVVAYGLILPPAVLNTPRYGCINIHASLLPRWRGAAPIQRAILAGDDETGVTIMQMDQGLDTGAKLLTLACPITACDTSESLHKRLATLGTEGLLSALQHFSNLTPEAQNNTLATYAHKITKEEAEINWQSSIVEIDRKIRAFNPRPVAFTFCDGEVVRIWQAKISHEKNSSAPGTILKTSAQGIFVAVSDGILQLEKIQLPGGRMLSVADILNSRQQFFAPGKKLG